MENESAELLAACQAGDNSAATKIFDKYVRRLIGLAKNFLSDHLNARVDPEDIVLSAYRSFFRKADAGEIVLKRSGDLWRLLAAYTVNKAKGCVEYHTAEKRIPTAEAGGSFLLQILEHGPTQEDAVALVDVLESFLQELQPRDRLILKLRLEGVNFEGIAQRIREELGADAATSEATIRRVLRQAGERLESQLFDEQKNCRE